jgi:hypothetical protein
LSRGTKQRKGKRERNEKYFDTVRLILGKSVKNEKINTFTRRRGRSREHSGESD